MGYVDLREIVALEESEDEDEQEQYTLWKDALKEQGIDIDDLACNKPTMIPDNEFENYAQELAEDIGAINSDARWPLNCIDWKEAAEELQQDYCSVDVDGETYWFMSS